MNSHDTTRHPEQPLDFFWFIPTPGDGSYLGSETAAAAAGIRAISGRSPQAVDRLGFPGVLLPTGQSCEDSWITATGLAAQTERLKYPRRAPARRRLAGLRGAADVGARPAEPRAAAAQRRRRRQPGRARRRRRLHCRTTSAMRRRRSSSPSGADCCRASRSTSTAST